MIPLTSSKYPVERKKERPILRPPFFLFVLVTALLRYNSCTIGFTHLKYVIQWFWLHSQSCETITITNFSIFLIFKFLATPCALLVSHACLTLCNPMDYSLLSSSVHGILQARILEWLATPFSRRSWSQFSCIASRFFTFWATREAQKKKKNHCGQWLQPWNEKTLAPWKKSSDKPRECI